MAPRAAPALRVLPLELATAIFSGLTAILIYLSGVSSSHDGARLSEADLPALAALRGGFSKCVDANGLGLKAATGDDYCRVVIQYPSDTVSKWRDPITHEVESLSFEFNVREAIASWEQVRKSTTVHTKEYIDALPSAQLVDLPSGGGDGEPTATFQDLEAPQEGSVSTPQLASTTPVPDPDRRPHETELTLGLVAGTGGVPQAMEISAPLIGGCIQLGNKIEMEDFNTRPLRIFTTLLVASLLAILWEKLWEPARSRMLRGEEQILPTTSITNSATTTLRKLWRQLKLMMFFSLTSGDLTWVLVFSAISHTSRPLLLFRLKMVMLIKLSLLVATLLLNFYDFLRLRLRCQPTGRHKGHDASILELQGEPPQSNNGTPIPPTILH